MKVRPRSDARRSAVLRTLRGSPSNGSPSGRVMSQNMRATAFWRGRQGSTEKVVGSGAAIMSDSSTRANPSMAEPSKAMPRSSALSNSATVMAKPLRLPRMSVNQSRMNLTSLSLAVRRTYAAGSLCPFMVAARKHVSPGPHPGDGWWIVFHIVKHCQHNL